MRRISISCDDCELEGSAACEDCVVSFVLSREPDDGVVLTSGEARALRVLSCAGLVPSLRFARRDRAAISQGGVSDTAAPVPA